MVLATAILLLQFSAFPGAAAAPQPLHKAHTTAEAAKPALDAKKTLPSVTPPATGVAATETAPRGDSQPLASNEITANSSLSDIYLPPPPAFRPKIEPVERTSHLWFALTAAEHGSATFDAWSTRRAISQGRAEADPIMRPFAHSAAIYGAIQVVPFGLDYVARRMQRSTGWTRHVWWVPQSVATAAYLFSGSYNLTQTR
ncbi:MAG TPA: hypothetical protein VJN90_03440 [Candidatus Acidoferrales bacterium]|nr:hypothetical protein [Candidatus Acidoferrales bacterium]